MKFTFWQNTNSIHQATFLEALAARGYEVTLIVTVPISAQRRAMGWQEPILKSVHIYKTFLDEIVVKDYIQANNTDRDVHVFSGLNAFPVVQQAFEIAVQQHCKIGIFTEPLDFRDFKGKLRLLRGFYHKVKWSSSIDFVLPTGKYAARQFLQWGYEANKVFEWAYTVKASDTDLATLNDEEKKQSYKLMFAGSLIMRKGYDILIEALKKIKDVDFQADFYCLSHSDLEEGKQIELSSGLGQQLNLLPFLSNDELRTKMNAYDLFVLPSRHDGWGAVISESLMEGTPVIASAACGSSSQIISSESVGLVVKAGSVEELKYALLEKMRQGRISAEMRMKNRVWAEKHISAKAMVLYFEGIIDFVNNKYNGQYPQTPWEKGKLS